MKPTVSLCMIVRNEEKNLRPCLQCVADLIDEIVVVDTGSTDETRAIAREFGAKVHAFPWTDDFAAARNQSIRHATGNWIFWMDADDRLDEPNRRRLAQLIATLGAVDRKSTPVFHMRCLCACPEQYEAGVSVGHGRMFANDSQLVWAGRVHERLVPVNGGAAPRLIPTDIAIAHQGYADPSQLARKQLRNARLIEQEFLTHPDDAAVLFYLARDRLQRVQDYPECVRFARRSVAGDPGRTLPTTAHCFAMIARCLAKLGKTDAAIGACNEGLHSFPDDKELQFERAYALRRLKRYEEARQCLTMILAAPEGLPALATTRPDIRCQARSMLGAIHQDQGNLAAAEAEFQQIAALYPHSAEGHFLLGQVQLFLGRREEAERSLERLAAMPNGKYELAMLRGMACLTGRQFGEAQRHLGRAMELRPDKSAPWIVLSSVLYQEGRDWARCIEAHEKALAKAPYAAEVRQRLNRMRAWPPPRRRAKAGPPPDALSGFHGSIMRMAERAAGGVFSC